MRSQNPNIPPDQQTIQDKCFHPTGTFVEFPRSALGGSLVDRFEEQVEHYPKRLALKSGGEELTYEELNSRANRIAHAIVEKSDDKQEAVALLFDHGTSAVAATLGVLKAGKTFVPMDVSHPSSKLRRIVENCEAQLLVTSDRNVRSAEELTGGKLGQVSIDDLAQKLSEENPGIRVPPDDPAFFVYASGSTGRPKGIAQNHRDFIHAIRSYTNALHVCADDRLTLLHSYSVGGAASGIRFGDCSAERR